MGLKMFVQIAHQIQDIMAIIQTNVLCATAQVIKFAITFQYEKITWYILNSVAVCGDILRSFYRSKNIKRGSG